MLGNLPSLADRNFVLGFMIPALAGGLALLVSLGSYGWAAAWINSLLAKDITSAAYAVIAVWLTSVLLLSFNNVIYRLLSGYLAPLRWLPGKRKIWERIAALQAEAAQLAVRFTELGDEMPAADIAHYTGVRNRLSNMPSTESDVLPTRFGNAVRSFEIYARDVYGGDGVTLWWRLIAVAPKDFLAAVQDARTQVDLPVNVCIVALLLAVVALLRGVSATVFGATPWQDVAWFFAAVSVCVLAYSWAVMSVPLWGNLVMAGFDCFLPTLATQLGHKLPDTAAQRREFWGCFSELANYRLYPDGSTPFDPQAPRPAKRHQTLSRVKRG